MQLTNTYKNGDSTNSSSLSFVKRNKKKLFVLILFIIVFFSSIFYFSINQNKQTDEDVNFNSPSPQIIEQIKTLNIEPGTDNYDDAIKKLGEPLSKEQQEEHLVLYYRSSRKSDYHELYLDNNDKTILFIKELVNLYENRYDTEIISVYGKPKYSLYQKNSPSVYKLFIYPEEGIAYWANSNTGNLSEIWRFTGMSYESFIESWGKDYTEERSVVQ